MKGEQNFDFDIILSKEQQERFDMPFHEHMKQYSEIKSKHDAEINNNWIENMSRVISRIVKILRTHAEEVYDTLNRLFTSFSGILTIIFLVLCVYLLYQIWKITCLKKKRRSSLPTCIHSSDYKTLLHQLEKEHR